MAITLDLRADVDTYLWTSTAESAHPGNGGVIRRWTNAINTAHKFDGSTDAASPTYRTPTAGALLLPNADFNDADSERVVTSTLLSTYIANNAFDMLIAFETDAAGTNNANSYDNTMMFADLGGYMGLGLKSTNLLGFNYDGSDDPLTIAISTGTAYVARFRHNGGNIYLSINGGAESSVASGNTQVIANAVNVGRSYTTHFFNGKIGRIVIANTGDELASLYATMVTDWVTGAAFKSAWARGANSVLKGFAA